MNNQLQVQGAAGASVDVIGAVTDRSYDGDDHAVGPCAPPSPATGPCATGSTVRPLTLGTSDGWNELGDPIRSGPNNYDTFIRNTPQGAGINGDRFTMIFSGVTIDQVSFDWQIFPDANCQRLPPSPANSCGALLPDGIHYAEQPDFKLYADYDNDGVNDSDELVWRFWGLTPGSIGGTPYTESLLTDNGNNNLERTPQLIGSGTWLLNGPVSRLDFVDWPATIGIDNLTITDIPPPPPPVPQVPEPGTLFLLGTGLLGLGAKLRRKIGS
jgi:hypothetical protein